jgi:hypothetical protein
MKKGRKFASQRASVRPWSTVPRFESCSLLGMSLEVTERLGYLGGPRGIRFRAPLPSVAARWRRPRAQHLAQQHDLAEMMRVVRAHVLDRIADGVPGERWVFDRRTDRSGGIGVAERGGTFQSSREARADGVPRSRRRRGPPERCAGRRRICRAVTSIAEPLLPEREVRHDFCDGMRRGDDAAIRVVP